MYWEGYFKYENRVYWATAQYIVEHGALPEVIEYEIYDHKEHEVSLPEDGLIASLEYKIADDLNYIDY